MPPLQVHPRVAPKRPTMGGLVVDIAFQGRRLRTVSFDAPELRIGRVPENEIVLDSPSVSSFHARLQLDAGRVFLEDGGSEIGSFVNEQRVRGRQKLAPGDRIVVGEHELRVRSRRLDEETTTESVLADAAEEPEAMLDPDDPIDAPLHDDFDFEPTLLAGPEEEDEALAAALLEEEGAGGEADAVEAEADDADVEAAGPVPALFAGLIVQREGKIDRVVPWEGDSLVVGRSGECDLVLPLDEVSRKHARFVRSDDRYEVHDLGSVNGTLVNGHRAAVHGLGVGDVISIESFELTFVLDREPIAGAMKPSPRPEDRPNGSVPRNGSSALGAAVESLPVETADASALLGGGDATIANVSLEEEPLDASPEGDVADGLDELPFTAFEAVEATIDDRKELATAKPRGSSRAASVQELGPLSVSSRNVTLELRVRMDQLPASLRRALEGAEAGDLVIPGDLRLRIE